MRKRVEIDNPKMENKEFHRSQNKAEEVKFKVNGMMISQVNIWREENKQ